MGTTRGSLTKEDCQRVSKVWEKMLVVDMPHGARCQMTYPQGIFARGPHSEVLEVVEN